MSPEDFKMLQQRVDEKKLRNPLITNVQTVVQARGNTEPRDRKMNKAERSYASQLSADKTAGRIIDFKFEGIKLRLADNTSLTMDFLVIDCDGFVQLHDCKAKWAGAPGPHCEDDYMVKVKIASEQYPWFQFRTTWQENGVWKYKIH